MRNRGRRYRGPLHGLPFGLKDLFAVRGTRTTWGATPYKDWVIDTDATVYTRLGAAGAVLVAKLSTGALAVERPLVRRAHPQPVEHPAGRLGIVSRPGSARRGPRRVLDWIRHGRIGHSPSARNGLTGLRPTFGRVSRYGAMTLAWTQDTVGPMCRSAEDCALVFSAIYGPDGKDNSVLDVPFGWDPADVSKLRAGYLRPPSRRDDGAGRQNNQEVLRLIRAWRPGRAVRSPRGRRSPPSTSSAAPNRPRLRRSDSPRHAPRDREAGPSGAPGPPTSASAASSPRSTTSRPTAIGCVSWNGWTRRWPNWICSSAPPAPDEPAGHPP